MGTDITHSTSVAAMLCAMHLNRGRQLPRDRMELYRNALHTLVHDRDADRNVPSATGSGLTLSDKLIILRDLAWRLSDNNRSEIDIDRGAEYVAAKLRAMRHLEILDGRQVLDQLRHRSGILRSPAQGRIDFVHRTFQEYLAAQEAAEEDRIGNLVGRAHLDLWRETIIMTAGHANTRQREELLRGILDRAVRESRHARTLRLLAAACQETLPSVSDDLANRLDDAVTRLLPARRRTDPPALAAVGPSLLRWLPRSLAQLTEASAVQTIRTVALIGGEEALNLLSGYVGDPREEVIEELIRAWAYFDADAYADNVVSRLPLAGRQVWLTHSGQLKAVGRLRSVSRVHVEYPVRGLDFVTQFASLEELWVDSLREGADLSDLKDQLDLRQLLLFGRGPMRNVSELANFKKLSWLAMPVSSKSEFEVLAQIPKLEFLSLTGINGELDLGPLGTLAKVRSLHLVGWSDSGLIGLENLAGMKALVDLHIFHLDVTAWLAAIKSAPPSLRFVSLHNCVVPSGGEGFEVFGNLKSLHLSGCRAGDGTPIDSLNIEGVRTRIQ